MGLIGFFANKGGGKTEACNYLQSMYTGTVASFATSLRAFLEEINVFNSRDNLIRIGEALQNTFTKHIFVQALARDIAGRIETGQNVFIDDVRFPQEISFIKRLGGIIVGIEVEDKELYRRIQDRVKEGEQDLTFVQFRDSLDSEYSELMSRHILHRKNTNPDVIIIENNGSMEEFLFTLDKLYFSGKNGSENPVKTLDMLHS